MSLARRQPATAPAPRFLARTGSFDGFDGVELVDSQSGARALFARRGATLVDWQVVHGGETVALADGYASAAELAGQDGVRNSLLAPFPNRIAGARYRFDGRDHDLLPGAPQDQRLIYHGFLRKMDMEVVATWDGDDRARVVFVTRILPDAFPGYPYALALRVEASLGARGIALRVTSTNLGLHAAPYACGWHPYFRLGNADLAHLELTVPAGQAIVTDAALIPLPGEAAFAHLAARPSLDFRRPRPIGEQALDVCYAEAIPDADGLIRSRLRDPATGRGLTVWQQGGLTHIFTGDTLARDPRRAVAIEPVEVMTNAFNRPELAEAISLAPSASRSFTCGAEFDPGARPSTPYAVPTA
jgi:aldose 1-epimerase